MDDSMELLETVAGRLRALQKDVKASCRENATALMHVEKAIEWLGHREQRRQMSGEADRKEPA